ncbi:lipase 3-like [Atheta coriaria]|uniref:lipase 3-like n=1 Tax=Dalotia coriaria TaxID=877792 RepID=UPI0031F40499
MASVRPEYNDKIRGHYSLAPTAYMNHMTSPLLRLLAVADGGLRFIFDLIEMYEFLPSKGFLTMVAKKSCGHAIFQPLCTNALFALCGFNNKQFNATLLPIVMGHTPAGSSLRQVLHYAQLVNSGKFRQYDFGLFGNHKKYGRLTPSNYNLKKITAAVYLFYSHNDWLASETDVRKLKQQLVNTQISKLVLNTNNQFNHLDYLYGIDAKTLVYDKVFEVMLLH